MVLTNYENDNDTDDDGADHNDDVKKIPIQCLHSLVTNLQNISHENHSEMFINKFPIFCPLCNGIP